MQKITQYRENNTGKQPGQMLKQQLQQVSQIQIFSEQLTHIR